MDFNCQFCNKIFSNNSNLKMHIKNAKYCIKLRGSEVKNYVCSFCNKELSAKHILDSHLAICSAKKDYEINNLKIKIKELENENKQTYLSLAELKFRSYENEENTIFNKIIKKDLENNDLIFILLLQNGKKINIEIKNDGYINATQLCNAGNKEFKNYKEHKNTQEYLNVISSIIEIPITDLIRTNKDDITYVHRKVAYHLSQWISPYFSAQVSNVLDELFITGKIVNYDKINSIKELEHNYQNKINELNNRLKKYEISAFKNKIDICPIPYYCKDVIYFLKFDIPSDIKNKYNIKYININDQNYSCIEFGVSSDIEDRLRNHKNDKKKSNLIFFYAIELNKRYLASKIEKYIKRIINQLNIYLDYENKKECFIANEDEFNTVINKIKEGINNLEIEKTIEDNDTQHIDIEKNIEKEVENQIKKVNTASDLLKNKLISIEDYKNILGII